MYIPRTAKSFDATISEELVEPFASSEIVVAAEEAIESRASGELVVAVAARQNILMDAALEGV